MIISIDRISDYKFVATDGEIGKIKEFLFDDEFWTIRYLVVSTGSLLNKRNVLISPYFISNINHGLEEIYVDLTQDQIKNSPDVDTEKPVSRQDEEKYYKYYGAPEYWGGPYAWGTTSVINRNREDWKTHKHGETTWKANLRSSKDVTGHKILAAKENIGDVEDFIIDDENWTIRYLLVDTGKWMDGKLILISPDWVDSISWDEKKVFVKVTSEKIRNAPEYDETTGLSRDYEKNLYDYYGMEGYWGSERMYGDYSRSVHR